MFFSPPLSSSSLPGASVNYITVTARQAMFAEFSDGAVSVKQRESEEERTVYGYSGDPPHPMVHETNQPTNLHLTFRGGL